MGTRGEATTWLLATAAIFGSPHKLVPMADVLITPPPPPVTSLNVWGVLSSLWQLSARSIFKGEGNQTYVNTNSVFN